MKTDNIKALNLGKHVTHNLLIQGGKSICNKLPRSLRQTVVYTKELMMSAWQSLKIKSEKKR